MPHFPLECRIDKYLMQLQESAIFIYVWSHPMSGNSYQRVHSKGKSPSQELVTYSNIHNSVQVSRNMLYCLLTWWFEIVTVGTGAKNVIVILMVLNASGPMLITLTKDRNVHYFGLRWTYSIVRFPL